MGIKKDKYILTLEAENHRLEDELYNANERIERIESNNKALYLFAEGLEHLASKMALKYGNSDVKEYEYIKHEIEIIKQRAFMEFKP